MMDGRTIQFLSVIDECSRLALAIRVGRCSRVAEVIDMVEELLKLYPSPSHLRMDNGPEFIAERLAGVVDLAASAERVLWLAAASRAGSGVSP
jgi:hypothetical protein